MNVISDFTVDMELRAYDASLIKLDVSQYFDLYTTQIPLSESENVKNILKSIGCNYIILPSNNQNAVLLEQIGCTNIGSTSDGIYTIYRF